MKTIITLLIFAFLPLKTLAQTKPVYFYCYKMEIGDVKTDKVVTKVTDVLVKIDAEKHTIGIATTNAKTQKVESSTRVFYKISGNGDNRSFYIKDDEGEAFMTVVFEKSQILYLDVTSNKTVKFYYNKTESEDD